MQKFGKQMQIVTRKRSLSQEINGGHRRVIYMNWTVHGIDHGRWHGVVDAISYSMDDAVASSMAGMALSMAGVHGIVHD